MPKPSIATLETRRQRLAALGRRAAQLRAEGETLRDIAFELSSNNARIYRALRSIGYQDDPTSIPKRRAQRLIDGYKALACRELGLSTDQALKAIGGSRARLYRAAKLAELESVDPMLR
jgi:hypothetical protein